MPRRPTSLLSFTLDSWLLALDASAVVGLRLAKIARMDRAAAAESRLMVTEKLGKAAQLQMKAATGQLGLSPARIASQTLADYRNAVSQNRKRLARQAKGRKVTK